MGWKNKANAPVLIKKKKKGISIMGTLFLLVGNTGLSSFTCSLHYNLTFEWYCSERVIWESPGKKIPLLWKCVNWCYLYSRGGNILICPILVPLDIFGYNKGEKSLDSIHMCFSVCVFVTHLFSFSGGHVVNSNEMKGWEELKSNSFWEGRTLLKQITNLKPQTYFPDSVFYFTVFIGW